MFQSLCSIGNSDRVAAGRRGGGKEVCLFVFLKSVARSVCAIIGLSRTGEVMWKDDYCKSPVIERMERWDPDKRL